MLQVNAAGTQQGSNQFSIDAEITGTTATSRVYALSEMSLFNNRLGAVSRIKLAEIEAVHAGKRLLVGLFDPGDFSGGSGDMDLDISLPAGPATCACYGERNDCSTFGSQASQDCRIQVRSAGGGNQYNGAWVRITIDIADGDTCGGRQLVAPRLRPLRRVRRRPTNRPNRVDRSRHRQSGPSGAERTVITHARMLEPVTTWWTPSPIRLE